MLERERGLAPERLRGVCTPEEWMSQKSFLVDLTEVVLLRHQVYHPVSLSENRPMIVVLKFADGRQRDRNERDVFV